MELENNLETVGNGGKSALLTQKKQPLYMILLTDND